MSRSRVYAVVVKDIYNVVAADINARETVEALEMAPFVQSLPILPVMRVADWYKSRC